MNDLAFTPDSRTLAIAGFDSRIHLWHLTPNALSGHDKEVWSLAFSPDGKRMASGADDSTTKIWDIASRQERMTLNGHQSLVTSVANSPDGAVMASASFDKTIRLWDATTGEPKGTLRGHTGRVRALAFSPDGRARWRRPGTTGQSGSGRLRPEVRSMRRLLVTPSRCSRSYSRPTARHFIPRT